MVLFKKKMHGRGAIATRGAGVVRVGKKITLVILKEGMDDIIRIIKLRDNLGVLIDGVNETVKHEIKRQEGGFLRMLLGTLGASILGNMLTGKSVIRAGKGVVKVVVRAGREYNNIDHMNKYF